MKEKFLASKIPVVYALLFVLNLILYILFEILVLYTLPANPDSTVLEKLDPRYGQSQVLWTESTGKMTCHLVQLSDGTLELITARRHDFSLKCHHYCPFRHPQCYRHGQKCPLRCGKRSAKAI